MKTAWSAITGCVRRNWLRPRRSPTPSPPPGRRSNISPHRIHRGEISGPAGRFRELLVIGIGGSALGPQLVSHALGRLKAGRDRMRVHFFDNTDPGRHGLRAQGDREPAQADPGAGDLQVRRHGRDAQRHARGRGGLPGGRARVSRSISWRSPAPAPSWSRPRWRRAGSRIFPCGTGSAAAPPSFAPWACCRPRCRGSRSTSCWRAPRPWTRSRASRSLKDNPAALLAAAWFWATDGRGSRDMVVLPYKDRLLLFSRYLQQLVMESLGKELDLQGQVVNQGIAVYGNKGSTDQHAYVQQLREGREQLLRHLHRGAARPPGRQPRGRGRRAERRLPAGLPARHARRAQREGPPLHHPHDGGGVPRGRWAC